MEDSKELTQDEVQQVKEEIQIIIDKIMDCLHQSKMYQKNEVGFASLLASHFIAILSIMLTGNKDKKIEYIDFIRKSALTILDLNQENKNNYEN